MKDRTEYEKMLAGELYNAGDEELLTMRVKARAILHQYNQTAFDRELRTGILKALLVKMGSNIDIQTPFFCDYGCHIEVGDNFFANFNCVFLDCNRIKIGNNVFLGPQVQLYTAHHPLLAAERIKGPELASPIHIGDNVWIGGGSIIPPNVLAVGNLCMAIMNL